MDDEIIANLEAPAEEAPKPVEAKLDTKGFKPGVGVDVGTSTPSTLDIFPIPSSDLIANPNLTQNPGY